MRNDSPTNITKLYPKNSGENPDLVLEQAIGKYNSLLILGWDKDELLDVRSTTDLKKADVIWLMEVFKNNLMSGCYDET